MADNLRAAAEHWAKRGNARGSAGVACTPEEDRQAAALARAYLAEHPPLPVLTGEGLARLRELYAAGCADDGGQDFSPAGDEDLRDGVQHAIEMLLEIKGRHPEVPDEGWRELDAVRHHLLGCLAEHPAEGAEPNGR